MGEKEEERIPLRAGAGRAALIAAAVVLLAGGFFAGRRAGTEEIDRAIRRAEEGIRTRYEADVKERDRRIAEIGERLRLSEERYRSIAGRIRSREKEAATIKKPEGKSEIRARLESLGYRPVD
ncbi:MAG: hypothetical protein K8I29_08475 [Alphaproteobacteria bacterium]|uniref:Uncharacterized protein n=1 Tax=Candidatus Nitrobium versatile TaxID=2884831 RepID=A0A953M1M5_9BACT|nr:hypothetical protein [Candidatus Nitrobium versatile]